MKRLLLALGCLSLVACVPAGASVGGVSTIPGVSQTCGAITNLDAFDTALKAYDVATDAVNLLIDFKVIKPGSPTALSIASANDKVLAAFSAAEHARLACNSDGYLAALNQARAAIADIRAVLPHRQ